MIKVTEIKLNPASMSANVALFADNKSDVTPNAEIQGLPDGYSIEFGSTVITAQGELAFMQSNGNWSWV